MDAYEVAAFQIYYYVASSPQPKEPQAEAGGAMPYHVASRGDI